jgi:hypothetical protein
MDADLKAEKEGLIFMETSPREEPITLYAMSDGEPIPMAPAIAELAIRKRYKGGGYMFTDKQEEAPIYTLGNVKCFLHPDSNEREILDEIGLAGVFCHSAHLASLYSKRVHGQHRHRQEWETLTEYRREQDTANDRRERQQQLEATLALARQAAGVPAPITTITSGTTTTATSARVTYAEPAPEVEDALPVDLVRNDCPACGWVNVRNTKMGLGVHTRMHCPGKTEATEVEEAIEMQEQGHAGSPSLETTQH